MTPVIAMLFGLAFGSFAGAAIHRIPRGESLLGRSRCDGCARDLRAHELIPLVSYMLQRGQCRTCAQRIGLHAFVLEGMTAALFGLAFSFCTFPTAVVVCTLALVAVICVVAARMGMRSYE